MSAIKVKSRGGLVRVISGRVGDFVFRAVAEETMLVFYQPKKKKGACDLPIMDREWTEDGRIMARFDELVRMFNLEVVGGRFK